MLNVVKQSLRIKHSKLDDDIQDDINACQQNLNMAGIIWKEDDALIRQAVKLYCRWQYNFEGEANRYKEAYDSLKVALALSGDYRE